MTGEETEVPDPISEELCRTEMPIVNWGWSLTAINYKTCAYMLRLQQCGPTAIDSLTGVLPAKCPKSMVCSHLWASLSPCHHTRGSLASTFGGCRSYDKSHVAKYPEIFHFPTTDISLALPAQDLICSGSMKVTAA